MPVKGYRKHLPKFTVVANGNGGEPAELVIPAVGSMIYVEAGETYRAGRAVVTEINEVFHRHPTSARGDGQVLTIRFPSWFRAQIVWDRELAAKQEQLQKTHGEGMADIIKAV